MTNISVVISAYNVEPYLRAALDSVLAQSLQPHEIIVVNDGSTDETEAVALSYGSRIHDINQENQGCAGARNTAIRAATGDWIAIFDGDDIMKPEKLAKLAAMIAAKRDLVIVYSGFDYLYTDGSTKEMPVFPAKDLWPALRYRTPILPSTSIIRRDVLLEVGAFNPVPTEDWDLWFRLVRKYSAAAFQDVPESLLLYRQLEGSLSRRSMNLARGILQLIDNRLLDGLSGISRRIWKRKLEAKVYYNLALSMRGTGDEEYWAFAIESFLRWPLFGKVVPAYRYLVLGNMLSRRLRAFRFSYRYWWPVRQCRERVLASEKPRSKSIASIG